MSIQVQTVVCIDDTTEDTTPVPLSQLSPTLQLSPAQPPPQLSSFPQLSPAQPQPSPPQQLPPFPQLSPAQPQPSLQRSPFPQLSPAQPQPSPPQLSPFPQLSPLPHLPVSLPQSSSLPEPPLPWAFQPSSSVAPVASLPLSPTHATPLAMSTTSEEVQHCTLLEIPHHLKSKASSAGNYKKAARILAATMFTVDERKSSTLSGGNGKKKLDPGRIILIHG